MPSTTASHLLPRPPSRNRTDRRGARRQVPADLTYCRVIVPGETHPVTGWLENLSVTGVGLLLIKPCPVGVTGPLLLINAAHTCSLRLEVRVVRCLRAANGYHLTGGQFTHCRDFEELVPFLM